MTDSGDRLDRYVRGELSPAEARELAQAALDSPELFAEATDLALVKEALSSGAIPRAPLLPFPRRAWLIAGVAAAAAVAVISLSVRRPASPPAKPALAISAQPGQPLLLASGLQPAPAPVFRGAESESRAPRPAGSIVSIEDGLATIDLGSLDGLATGSELSVFHEGRAIGRVQVTTVFRERARGRILDGHTARVRDQVRVDGATHADALSEHIDALYNRGDVDAAYQMAEQASRWAETASVLPVRQSALSNKCAVLHMLRGDYDGAAAFLTRAASNSPEGRNNLGVLAELRGDRRKAESLYAQALDALPEPERRAAEANLARVRGSR